MSPKLKLILLVIFILNLLTLDVFLFLFWKKQNLIETKPVESQLCPSNCNEIIDDLITQKINNLPTPEINQAISPTPIITKKTVVPKTKSTQYIPIPGSGTTLENKWVDLLGTEFYISTNDYPNLIGAYFEANIKLLNGNGLAYLRLFDITAGIEVWGSEISTNSQSFTSVSSEKLTIRPGNHLYRVQAKSLTADTTIYNSGKIKIILENY